MRAGEPRAAAASCPAPSRSLPPLGTTDAQLVAAVNSSVPDAEALTRADAADKTPGVAQVRQSFQVIFLLYALVVPLVTGLFFLIITLQKAGSLTLLRADRRPHGLAGPRRCWSRWWWSSGSASGSASPCTRRCRSRQVGGLPLRFDPGVVLTWSALLIGLGLVSALVSLRRVLRIDPIEATTGGGVR